MATKRVADGVTPSLRERRCRFDVRTPLTTVARTAHDEGVTAAEGLTHVGCASRSVPDVALPNVASIGVASIDITVFGLCPL